MLNCVLQQCSAIFFGLYSALELSRSCVYVSACSGFFVRIIKTNPSEGQVELDMNQFRNDPEFISSPFADKPAPLTNTFMTPTPSPTKPALAASCSSSQMAKEDEQPPPAGAVSVPIASTAGGSS